MTMTTTHPTRYPEITGQFGATAKVSGSTVPTHPYIWLHTVAASHGGDPGTDRSSVAMHLAAENAWHLAAQLAEAVTDHGQGDARPVDSTIGIRDAIVAATGWQPDAAEALMRALATHGVMMLDTNWRPETESAPAPLRPRLPLETEPPNGSLAAELGPDGDIEAIHIRDDAAAAELRADFPDSDPPSGVDLRTDPAERWFPYGEDRKEFYPASWKSLFRTPAGGLATVVHLRSGEFLPRGVHVRQEWAPYSAAMPEVFDVVDHTTAVRIASATPGGRPASRYVIDTPHGTVYTGWVWPETWMPPPAALAGVVGAPE